jgi:D-alanine-D-alanine ligase
MKKIAILSGGYSSERHISINSANQIYSELDKNKYNVYLIDVNKDGIFLISQNNNFVIDMNNFSAIINNERIYFDFVVNALHGTPGEDGKIQSYLDLIGLPYSSCGVFTSALTFDKIATKKVLSDSGIRMAKMVEHRKGEEINYSGIAKLLNFPCFVKPNMAGSSYGVTKVFKEDELQKAVDLAHTEDDTVLIEEFIEGIEVSCGLFKTSKRTCVLPITEIDTKNEYFDTDAKYDPELTDEITPARVPVEHSTKVQKTALRIYEELNCKGLVRIDFIIKNGEPYFLELNTIPGMSAASIVPKQLITVGMTIGEAFGEIIEDGLQ